MAYLIRLGRKAQKEYGNLEKRDRLRVSATLLDIAKNPFVGKKLHGDLAGRYAVRVWPLRVVYEIVKMELVVVVVGIRHRGGAYR